LASEPAFELDTLRIVDAHVEELHENPGNPRTIDRARFDALVRSLEADPSMMAARPLIALPDGTVIAGNMRLRAAKELGWRTVPTVFADLPPERARLWLLRDNNAYGDWHEEQLATLIAELRETGADLLLTGFAERELDDLIASLDGNGLPDDRGSDLALADVSIGDPAHDCAAGETWALGPHLLVIEPIYDGWQRWIPLLGEGDLLVPYPTPTLPLTQRAQHHRLVMVQPDPWLAGHVLDKYAAVRGEGEIVRVNG
jgi:ParB-like nuclease domain